MDEKGVAGLGIAVTSADTALGKAIVERLSGLGAIVAEVSTKDGEEPGRLEAAISASAERTGRLDAVVLNFPPMNETVNAAELTPDMAWASFSATARQCFIAAKAASSLLAEKGGSIVTLIEADDLLGKVGRTGPSAAAGAMLSMVRTWSLELGRMNIIVNAISYGTLDDGERSPEQLKSLPLRRGGTLAEVADTVAWLAGRGSRFVTGQNIFVSGGSDVGRTKY